MPITDSKIIKVVSYCGYCSDERPIYLIIGKRRIEVKDVRKRWRDQEFDFFRVLTTNGIEYFLKRHRGSDNWFMVMS
ncbi:hypothetical protein ACFL2O_05720 [Thermodesulfobacteriota bacterium]